MSGQRGSETRQRSEQIKINVDPVTASRIDRVCDARDGLPRARVCREIVEAHFAVRDSRVRRYRRGAELPPEDVIAVKSLAGEIGKLNGSVRQLAETVWKTGDELLHGQVQQALAELKEMQRRTDRLVDKVAG